MNIIGAIKTDYITKGYSVLQLQHIYNISQYRIHKFRRAENWDDMRRKYIDETEIKRRQAFSIESAKREAEADFMSRQERAKAFKQIVDDNITKIKSGELKIKSQETLLTATVDTSKHIELLEGNPTERDAIILNDKDKQEVNKIYDRLRLNDTKPLSFN